MNNPLPLTRTGAAPAGTGIAAGPTVRLRGLGTALPPHALPQSQVLEAARALLAPQFPHFERLVPAFDAAGVEMRHSVVPMDWFHVPHGWEERNAAYMKGATELFIRAAKAALADARIAAAEVDIVVTVSSTGIATPTLDAQAAGALGLRPDTRRVPLFGLGCAGGVTGLATARALAAASPGATVLLVAVETCSLAFRSERPRKADIIATVLFGDGAAAAVVTSGGGPPDPAAEPGGRGTPIVHEGHEHRWPDTLGIMGWDVKDDGLGVVFDRSIPQFARDEFRAAAMAALSRMGRDVEDVERFVCHPGGTKVMLALEEALDMPQGRLDHEREVLRGAGNMSAPTVLFVLKRCLEAGERGDLVMAALGPGFTASFLPITA
ncbi:type III polyketide synthase [Profundibacterium mesophilum]|uniref:Chalcone synthase n=1 Tax=Profundibacterium mesophilum KAUST100406-0324 TaxID=1037889 RepID=A0A921NV27_9RHOB|nr:type III polyketide synthase [Profundibacterium mesophilum]KAF0676143.1 chalcone synthase [Profundibacterium mesophilum KAUST100406-0324]